MTQTLLISKFVLQSLREFDYLLFISVINNLNIALLVIKNLKNCLIPYKKLFIILLYKRKKLM